MDNLDVLLSAWANAKKQEKEANEWRRQTEDAILKTLRIAPEFEGTENFEVKGYKLKIVGTLNRKIDADRLQEVAAEHCLSDHLGALFRWKPYIHAENWKAADPAITKPLLGAITTSPGRPHFTITTKEQ